MSKQRVNIPGENMKFKTVLLGPPWTYETWSGPDLPTRQASAVGATLYPVMTDNRLFQLPIQNILDSDTAVFMWATMPKLDIAIQLGQAWGLTYKTVAFTWAKLNPSYAGVWFTQPMNTSVWKTGLGYWTRANCELVLLFTRGNPKRQAMDVPQLVVSPINGHSQKPEEVQNRIERLVPGPYCELFARRVRPGWTCLGNEIDGLDIFDAIEKVANEVTE